MGRTWCKCSSPCWSVCEVAPVQGSARCLTALTPACLWVSAAHSLSLTHTHTRLDFYKGAALTRLGVPNCPLLIKSSAVARASLHASLFLWPHVVFVQWILFLLLVFKPALELCSGQRTEVPLQKSNFNDWFIYLWGIPCRACDVSYLSGQHCCRVLLLHVRCQSIGTNPVTFFPSVYWQWWLLRHWLLPCHWYRTSTLNVAGNAQGESTDQSQ